MNKERIFVIGDTHFGHDNILKFTASDGSKLRTFSSTEEMNEVMVENWNRVVKNDDLIIHLGDVYFGEGWKEIYKLKGRKILLLGNHDNGKCYHLNRVFEKIMLWRVFRERDVTLSHMPLHNFSLFHTKYQIHGHTHKDCLAEENYINCSAEMIDFTPILMDEVLSNINKGAQNV